MNVLFLDIDGVLQAYNAVDRFNNDLIELQKELAVKYNDAKYLQMDKYDLGAVVFDWDQKSLSLLKKVLDDNQCRIVVEKSEASLSQFSVMMVMTYFSARSRKSV